MTGKLSSLQCFQRLGRPCPETAFLRASTLKMGGGSASATHSFAVTFRPSAFAPGPKSPKLCPQRSPNPCAQSLYNMGALQGPLQAVTQAALSRSARSANLSYELMDASRNEYGVKENQDEWFTTTARTYFTAALGFPHRPGWRDLAPRSVRRSG